MKGGVVFAVVLNDCNPDSVAGVIQRASLHCERTGKALVVEFTPEVPVADLRPAIVAALSGAYRASVVAMIVHRASLAAARAIGQDLAAMGLILGEFTKRNLALNYAVRELELASFEPSSSSASSVRNVLFISA